MRLNATGLINGLSATIRRSIELPLAGNKATLRSINDQQSIRFIHKTSRNYCPIYSLSNEYGLKVQGCTLYGKVGQPSFTVTQCRSLAKTSSGYFAPSTIHADRQQVGSHAPRDILSVYEDNEQLPALPVPDLDETMERLRQTIWPIAMNSAEFAHTLYLIDKFSQSAGKKLDQLLRSKSKQTKNWMTHDWWMREIYLKSRSPLVINSNPSMIYPVLPFEVNNQRVFISTVAHLINGIIDYKLALESGYNPEATNSDNELHLDPYLCYDQYKDIFGSIRVPGEHCDSYLMPKTRQLTQAVTSDENTDPSQRQMMHPSDTSFKVIISFRGSFFEIQLKDFDHESNRIDTLIKILEKMVDSVNNPDFENAPGVLTASDRDKWANNYKLLDKESMQAISEAQFHVCIDTIPQEPQDPHLQHLIESSVGSEQHLASLARQILHGDQLNVGNRWFDKPIQLIVVADENAERLLGAGINYEHSLAEGIVVSKMIEYSYDKTIQKQREQKESFFGQQQQQQIAHDSNCPATFRQLKMFDSDSNLSEISEQLKQAKQNFISQINQFGMSCLNYKQYGANSIKSWHFSPDSWLQVALQLAYYNLHKRPGPCYETASTRRFAHGRTETIRSLTKEVAEFCFNPKYETMQAAITSHKTYANAANNALAIDRVLMGYKLAFNELRSNNWSWGLSMINKDEGQQDTDQLEAVFSEKELETLSAFFNNELIERSRRFALSTSQVSSIHPNIFMTYGPILADGYGCCYNITGQQIVAAITANSLNQSFSCEVDDLNASLRDSLNYMRDIVEEQQRS